jgi:hypothetical protein
MRKTVLTAGLLVTVAGTGFVVGRKTAPDRPPAASPGPASTSWVASAAHVSALLDGDQERGACRAEVRALRADLRSLCPGSGAAAVAQAGAATPAEPAAPSAEQLQTLERGRTLVHMAQQQRRWRASERDALRQLLPALAGDQRDELIDSLFAAVNRGEVRVETEGPPL